MIFMKWKNPGITYFGGGGGSNSGGSTQGTPNPPSFTSSMEELAGQVFNSQEELDAAENSVNAANTVTATQEQVDQVAQDPQGTFSSSMDNITNIKARIDSLSSQLTENPELQSEIDSLMTQLGQEESKLGQAKEFLANQQAVNQQQLVSSAMTNPQSIIEQAQVASTQVQDNQLIAEGAGEAQDTGQAESSTVSDTAVVDSPARQEAAEYDAKTVSEAVEEATQNIEAATGGPSEEATVRGQLEILMEDFEGGGTPPWASGAMRKAMGVMQSRGMGASSIAGQAVVQAAMESALSIASQDANTNAQFEMQSLNNEQQTTIFKAQQRMSGLFSDQAAENASKQFNATSENQTNQFFYNLEQQASTFNASQINGIRQFNAQQEGAVSQFNASLRAQREQFNAQNSLIISQANAQWRQSIATAETAAQNMANLEYTKNVNAITGAQLDQIWQRERDLMDYAFTSSESALDRAQAIVLEKLRQSGAKDAQNSANKAANNAAMGKFIGQLALGFLGI